MSRIQYCAGNGGSGDGGGGGTVGASNSLYKGGNGGIDPVPTRGANGGVSSHGLEVAFCSCL